MIKPIKERYSSFLRRIWYSRRDEVFDDEVRQVLGSMNNVGVTCVDPELFTTVGRRRELLCTDKFCIVVGAFWAIMGGFVAHMLPEFYKEPYREANIYLQRLVNLAPGIGLVAPYILFKPGDNSSMRCHLSSLEESARKTDKFLRQHKI